MPPPLLGPDTMHDTHDRLTRLLAYPHDRDALVVSVYLDLSPEAVEETVEAVVDACERLVDPAGEPAERLLAERLADLQAELPFVIEAEQARGYAGLAWFVSSHGALDVQLSLRFPLRTQVVVGHEPLLHQLLVFDEEYERSICVTVPGPGLVSLCEVRMGDVSRSRLLHAHHEDEDLAPRLDAELGRLLEDDPRLHVIVLGEAGVWAALEPRLGAGVRAAIIDRLDEALTPDDAAFLPAVHRALQRWERRVEAEGVTRLLDAHARGGAAVVGLGPTLDAIAARQVDTLYVLQAFRAEGWRCDGCEALDAGPLPPVCTTCGASVGAVAVEEHMLDAAARAGAVIETVADSESLQRAGGIGATLRAGTRKRAVVAA